jgi:hypothetical protein
VGKPSKPADFGQLRMTGRGKSVAEEKLSHGGNEQQEKMDDHAGQKMWCVVQQTLTKSLSYSISIEEY